MPLDKSIKKVLVIGSGPIVIGQAAEFDYAGTQACRILRQEGVKSVLVNSNPATIMTDGDMADAVYLEPLNEETIKRIILKEKPNCLLAGLGGQTGLTIAMKLSHEGFLAKHGVRLIGTNAEAIDKAEDRELFKEAMARIGQPTVPSGIANDIETSIAVANEIGYPVIIRPAFTLGGGGGGVAYNEEELREVAFNGLEASPITQILVEKYIFGWKEIEFEVMRDHAGNVITVCSMENFDPVGIHTGDSIVVAPALTLADPEYQMLRSAALNIITEMGIEGGCNCQFALNPDSFEYSVIEVNPRVSRSSALASKATGYPIAKVAVKIALGYTLDEIKNDITGKTFACFEPALDYVVVKFPKWPFDKFHDAQRKLGTQMKATGEVMAIGHTFEAALLKAIRGAEIGQETLTRDPHSDKSVIERLGSMDDLRLFTIFEALKKGVSADKIHEITMVDHWFISKLKNLVNYEEKIRKNGIDSETYLQGKKYGYTDKALTMITGIKDLPHIDPVYKMVDTCAAEFEAETPYYYASYDSCCDARAAVRNRESVIVIGSGPIRIGQGIEFDYSSVHCAVTLKELGYDVVIINNNPETVSTDYDTADRLYFEPLCPEDVMGVIKVEKPVGVVVAFGGQTAIKLTEFLDKSGVKILGTSAEGIDLAEDRERFDALLGRMGINRPKGYGTHNLEEAMTAAHELGYPVLLRPSYVIGGQNMVIAHDDNDVRRYMNLIMSASDGDNSVLVDKYMSGTELEVDVISDGTDVLMPGIMEHIERAGIHSGDSIAVYPPYNLTDKMINTIVDCSQRLALELGTRGLVNIQYLIYKKKLYVIEVNPRASRTVPYLSKVTGIPMVDVASRVMMGATLKELGYNQVLCDTPPYYAIKVPVFSFEKIMDANSTLGPEMKSTGEVLGIGRTLNEALHKGLRAAGYDLSRATKPGTNGVLLSIENHDLEDVVKLAKKLSDLHMTFYATPDTAKAITSLGVKTTVLNNIKDSYKLLEEGKISFIIYTGALYDDTLADYIDLHSHAVRLGVPVFTSIDTSVAVADTLLSRFTDDNTELVNLNTMRKKRELVHFAKMHSCGNDYIFFDNRDGRITSPESLCVTVCDRNYGIGGCGIVLIENSAGADAKMRIFNQDGSEGKMAGNSIRCVGKYLYDKHIVPHEFMTIQTDVGVKPLQLFIRNGKVSTVSVHMGEAKLYSSQIPATVDEPKLINYPYTVGDKEYRITCSNVGNPHCTIFCDDIESIDIEKLGPLFENAPIFPEKTNTEFVKVVNDDTLRVRVYERSNGETMASGTGACAAVIAATENGYLQKGHDITVKLKGGDLIVNYTDERVILTGDAVMVYEGVYEY